MGYSTRPSMVEDQVELLQEIKTTVVEGNEKLRLSIRDGDNISTEQWRLRRLLAATDRHPQAAGGKFFGMGQAVRIKVEGLALIVVPKIGASLTKANPTEADAMLEIQGFQGDIFMLTFEPSPEFNEASFAGGLLTFGWILHMNTKQIGDDGIISYAAERLDVNETGFDLIGKTDE